MPLLPAFAQAIFHDLPRDFDPRDPWSNHRVLGLRLRPFCLWHLALLQQIESPLLAPLRKDAPAAPPAPRDLLRAVRICRLRWPVAEVGAALDWRALRSMLGGFAKQLAAFSEYITDFQAVPDYVIVPPPERFDAAPRAPRGAPPALLRIWRDVIAAANCTRQEAWETPVGEANWLHALADSERHECDFMTQEKREEQERIEREHPELWAQMRAAAEAFKNQKG